MLFEKKKVLKKAEDFKRKLSEMDPKIFDETILLIGPMGTGKSSVAKIIEEKTDLERTPLDSKGKLEQIYSDRKKYRNFKNFEFFLTGTVLSSLEKPEVIDFGAGHSIYEDKDLRAKMDEICAYFKNIILLLPTEDKEKNRKILLERRNIKEGSHKDQDNWHFLTTEDNYKMATNIVYEEGKTIEEVADEIISICKEKRRNTFKEELNGEVKPDAEVQEIVTKSEKEIDKQEKSL